MENILLTRIVNSLLMNARFQDNLGIYKCTLLSFVKYKMILTNFSNIYTA